jgi:acetate kinase
VRVLVVNAGSTSLKRHLVTGERSEPVDGYVPADAVGHRIVHGGRRLTAPALVDRAIERELEAATELAPLHNAPALRALADARAALPEVPHVAVFDTAFHATMPPAASTLAVPERWRQEWGIRRYGFHGLSVQWVSEQVKVARLIVCHLGGGCSVTAVLDGRSVDTTMGFTPLDGVPMATRSGAVDPGVLLHLLHTRRRTPEELGHDLEHESGLLGLSGSADVRELDPGHPALAVYVHRIAAAVGAMAAALGGADAIAFTGGVGEHSAAVRERVMARVGFLDAVEHVVAAREELVIAAAVRRCCDGGPPPPARTATAR